MSVELWAQVGTAGGSAVAAAYAALKSRKAEKNTKATSNGFAGKVLDRLERIENKIDHHIESHADADVRRN